MSDQYKYEINIRQWAIMEAQSLAALSKIAQNNVMVYAVLLENYVLNAPMPISDLLIKYADFWKSDVTQTPQDEIKPENSL
jgi:hypothetical protein